MYLGHVDTVSKLLLSGWAISKDPNTPRPVVAVVQRGTPVLYSTPMFPGSHVWKAHAMLDRASEKCVWRIHLPLAHGLEPDVPFDIQFLPLGQPLAKGRGLTIERFADIDSGANSEIQAQTFTSAHYLSVDEHTLLLHFSILHNALPSGHLRNYFPISPSPSIEETEHEPTSFYKKKSTFKFRITPDSFTGPDSRHLLFGKAAENNPSESNQLTHFHESLRSLSIPRSAVEQTNLRFSLPNEKHIHRVSGPSATQTTYQVGGATTFWQIDTICRRYLDRSALALEAVVDWGVGCGRVARQFWEFYPEADRRRSTIKLFGYDIDRVNIDWCKEHLAHCGDYATLELEGRFGHADDSIDLLYGISVMTHLSGISQEHWLKEIFRVLKPGGLAVLTTHGEYYYYRSSTSIAVPFVEAFGFFDGIEDGALGKDLSKYYRATFQTRKYTRERWGRLFQVVDVISGANAFTQDIFVLRKP